MEGESQASSGPDFTSKKLLVTIRAYPEQLGPITSTHLDVLLSELQKADSLLNYVVTLQAPLCADYCVCAPRWTHTGPSEVGVRKPAVVVDVVVWDNIAGTTTPSLIVSGVKEGWKKFMTSQTNLKSINPDDIYYIIQVAQAPEVKSKPPAKTNIRSPSATLPAKFNGFDEFEYSLNWSKSTEV